MNQTNLGSQSPVSESQFDPKTSDKAPIRSKPIGILWGSLISMVLILINFLSQNSHTCRGATCVGPTTPLGVFMFSMFTLGGFIVLVINLVLLIISIFRKDTYLIIGLIIGLFIAGILAISPFILAGLTFD